ncbi:MAG: response regulator [Candidatus Pacebacteria bacterium]|nr:response regulator [Candidatus Paceibacterota bacterium]
MLNSNALMTNETARRLRWLLMGSLFVSISLAAVPQCNATAKKVLLIQSYHDGLVWTDALTDSIAATLSNNGSVNVSLTVDYLDTKRHQGDRYNSALHELYKEKYAEQTLDLIICADDPAFDFVLTHRQSLFPNTPVVFCGINYFDPARIAHESDVTGVVETLDLVQTLNLALRLHKDAQRILVINDQTRTGMANKRLFTEQVLPYFASDVNIEFVENVTIAQAQDIVGGLDHQTVVLLLSFTRDAAGHVLSDRASLRSIASHSAAPLYGVWDFQLGHGIIGGKLTSAREQGATAADLALKVLTGEKKAGQLQVVMRSPNRFMFDYEQMQKFNIKRDQLPPESTIINTPPTFVKVPKQTAWATIALTILFGVAVLFLLFTICLRQRAEKERRRLATHIQQAQKLESLGVMAGGIAHDFNNLLMGILGNATLTLMDLPNESPAAKHLKQIQNNAERAAKLTNQLLAYSGRGKLITQPLRLTHLVHEMRPLVERAVTKQAKLHWKIHHHDQPINADPAQLRQVVINLISNASEAIDTTQQSGDITVRVGTRDVDGELIKRAFFTENLRPGKYVFLEVSDTGCGMDRDMIHKIFDPFFSTKFIGRGLGLAAVAGIVRGHAGALWVTSSRGQGTTVRVLFPPSYDEDKQLHDEASSNSGVQPERADTTTILVVDDEEGVRDVCASILQRHGYRVVSAVDGEQGIQRLQENKHTISLVLLDVTMPGKNGFETLTEIRKTHPHLPVILSSGYSEEDAGRDHRRGAYESFIQKPYVSAKLISRVEQMLTTPATAASS